MRELHTSRWAAVAVAVVAGAVIGVAGQVAHTGAAYRDQTHGRTDAIPVGSGPVVDLGLATHARMVDTGLGLGNDRNVYMWGRTNLNIGGSVSDPGVNRPPSKIPGMPEGGICQVTGQIYDANALDCDGTVWGWGAYNDRNGTDASRPGQNPQQLRIGTPWNGAGPLLDGIVTISSTEQAGAGIRADGTVWIWGVSTIGDGPYGGNGTLQGATQLNGLPDPSVPGNRPVYVKGAYANFFVILQNGEVYSWGGASSLPAGPPAQSPVSTAFLVTPLSPWFRSNVSGTDPYVVAVDGGINMGGAVLSNGQVLSWSRGGAATRIGQRPTSPTPANAPGIVPTLADVQTMQFGFTGVAFGVSTGDLWGYGASDDYGELPMTPDRIDTDAVAYGSGQGFYIWQKSDGTFWGRGYNPAGAIGTPDGTVTTNRQVSYDMSVLAQ